MSPIWTASSAKHGIPRADIAYAIANATYSAQLERTDHDATMLYIGAPHAQTEREIEVLVTVYEDGREAIIFHAMPLRDMYRQYREDYPS